MVKSQNRESVSSRVVQRINTLEDWGITQSEIASRLNVSASTVSRWASGATVPKEDNRRRLYGLTRRETVKTWPKDITSKVVKDVIKNSKPHPSPLFIQPVASGRVPEFYNRKKVFGAYVVVNVTIEFQDGKFDRSTSTIQRRIPAGASMSDSLIFDGIEQEWRKQIKKISDSARIKNYTVDSAYIRLSLPTGMMNIQFRGGGI